MVDLTSGSFFAWALLASATPTRSAPYKSFRTIVTPIASQIHKSYICICQCLFNYLVNLSNMFTGRISGTTLTV